MNLADTIETAGDAPEDPLGLFRAWQEEAEQKEPVDPNAMALATVDGQGRPSVRIMLLKGFDERGFVFYTNMESNKGRDLKATGRAALCFYWKSMGKQVRIDGLVEQVSDEEADEYFASRPRGSRIGAWVSQQSRSLESRSVRIARTDEFENKFAGQEDIPRPPYWSGYRLKPELMEFWHQGESRLHTRVVYTLEDTGNGWHKELLYP